MADAMDEFKEVVAELKKAIQGLAEGKVDRETVDAMMQAALTQSRQVGITPHTWSSATNGVEGYVPEDRGENVRDLRGKFSRMSLKERFDFALYEPPSRVAPMLRCGADTVRDFQKASDELLLVAHMTKQRPSELDFYHDVYAPIRDQAMDTKTTGEGKELVPIELSTDLLERLEGQLQVLGLFPTIQMPSNPFEFPVRGPRQHVALLAEALEPGTPKAKKLLPGTPTKLSLTATKFAGEIVTSKELEEDAAIAILPFLEAEMREWLAWDLEDACINGDATAPHMDSGVAADSPKMGWNGLRAAAKTAAAEFDAGGSGLTLNVALQTRAKMGRYGTNPGDLIWIVPVACLYQMLAEDRLTTVDQYGAGATVLTGEVGRLWGSPVISSDMIPKTMDATGVVPAVASTFSAALVVNPSGFIHGMRRGIQVQTLTELYAESDQDAVLLTTRQAFSARYPTEPTIAAAIHLGLAIPTLP